MAETKEILLTRIGMAALISGLEYLKTEKRSEITEKIKIARGFGDLSENAEYDEAKNEQAEVESKINQLMNMQKYTRVIADDEIIEDTVCIGNTIEIQEVGEDEVEKYAVVSADEIEMYAILNSDMDDVLLSANSPVGKALLGHKAGETVSVQTPACTIEFVIKSIYKYTE
ncbi:MAG: transcription elongation factor GreA [Clostridia bacterium]|nr:transcription elongation factor GreA [Clostridia bacterium]